MSTVTLFLNLVSARGSNVIYHRAGESKVQCPCLTVFGYRDPEWHIANPAAPVCNEAGYLNTGYKDFTIKGFVQPIQSTRATRLSTEYLTQMFGEVEADDHLGIFPCEWSGNSLDFKDWSQDGDEYLEYADEKFLVVNSNLIPDPSDGNPFHHWEVGLRLIS